MKQKKAKVSILSSAKEYFCKYPWSEKTLVQCGDRGVVVARDGNYRTAFFEAFPPSPKTFIRGEGDTLEEAEKSAWAKYQRIKQCPGHEYERRGRVDGYAFCVHCNLSKTALAPLHKCVKCPSKQVYTKVDNQDYCRRHYLKLSFDEAFPLDQRERRSFLATDFLIDKVVLELISQYARVDRHMFKDLSDFSLYDQVAVMNEPDLLILREEALDISSKERFTELYLPLIKRAVRAYLIHSSQEESPFSLTYAEIARKMES